MATLPTLVKTHQFNANNQVVDSGVAATNYKTVLLAIKNAILGIATGAPTIGYSCSSTVAGSANDGVDRWATTANIVIGAPGAAHSWFVFKCPGLATSAQVLFSCEASSILLLVVYSPSAGFTGGSTTARPTATDEVVVSLSAGTALTSAAAASTRWSVDIPTDGSIIRILTAWSGNPQVSIEIQKPLGAVSGWSNPIYAHHITGMGTNTVGTLASGTSPIGRIRIGTTNGNAGLTCEGNQGGNLTADTNIGNIANEVDGGWMMPPPGVACYTSGIRGRHASLIDIYFGSPSVASGDGYPADGSNQFIQYGAFAFPWNGSTPAFS